MSPLRPGIGLLAKELNVPVVPVKLHGLYELKQRQQYFAPPGMVSVVFGEPVKFDPRLDPTAIAAGTKAPPRGNVIRRADAAVD